MSEDENFGNEQPPIAPRATQDDLSILSGIPLTNLKDKYEFLSELGSGAFGTVYKARQLPIKRLVAIKMIHSHLLTPTVIKRFLREAQTISRFSHPNIVSIFDFGISDEKQPFMVMDYVEGTRLDEMIRDTDPFPLDLTKSIVCQVCDGLSHAHAHGILHRDLKPSNLILVKLESGLFLVKILDFGLAKILDGEEPSNSDQLTEEGDTVGTPAYMSPEQVMGKQLDQRSDLYSLGCVMYHCLAGVPPFLGETRMATMLMQLNDAPVSLNEPGEEPFVPVEIEALMMKMLAKQPSERPQSMTALKDAMIAIDQRITDAGSGLPVESLAENRFFALEEKASRKKLPVKLVIASVALSVVALIAAVYFVVSIIMPDSNQPTLSTQSGETAQPAETTRKSETIQPTETTQRTEATPPTESKRSTDPTRTAWFDWKEKGRREQAAQSYTSAIDYYLRSLAEASKLGPDSMELIETKIRLAICFVCQKKFDDAEPYYQAVCASVGKSKMNKSLDAEMLVWLEELADSYNSIGRKTRGNRAFCLQHALALRDLISGDKHPMAAITLRELGQLYVRQGNIKAAEPVVARLVRVDQKYLGKDSYVVASDLYALGFVESELEKWDASESHYRQALAIMSKKDPVHRTFEYFNVRVMRARSLEKMGELALCEKEATQALAEFERGDGKGKGHMTTLARHRIASVRLKQKRYAEALQIYEKCIALAEPVFGPNDPRMLIHWERMQRVYKAMKDTAKVNELEQRMEKIKTFQSTRP
jgi:serine/threonine-protein kinase